MSEKMEVYKELCASYRAIDDFRTKLLGFLPLATGAGAFALLAKTGDFSDVTKEFFLPIGIFGLFITIGLCAYELYGITKCHFLIETGKKLESDMRVRGHCRRPSRDHQLYPVAARNISTMVTESPRGTR